MLCDLVENGEVATRRLFMCISQHYELVVIVTVGDVLPILV